MAFVYVLISFTRLRLSYPFYVSNISHRTSHRVCAPSIRKENKISKNVKLVIKPDQLNSYESQSSHYLHK